MKQHFILLFFKSFFKEMAFMVSKQRGVFSEVLNPSLP